MANEVIKISELPESIDYGNLHTIGTHTDAQGNVTSKKVPLANLSNVGAKADKVADATANNFAGLDANGNLKDSGKKASDFATASQGAKADSALQPSALEPYRTSEQQDAIDETKVDKVAGKGLSSEDYTAAEKGKVANLPADTNAAIADLEERKADKDGFYESLGAGYAKSLLGNGAATPELIDFRPSGGTKDIATGVQTLKTLFGNTVVMNQSVVNRESSLPTGWYASGVDTTVENGIVTITPTEENSHRIRVNRNGWINGHVYLLMALAMRDENLQNWTIYTAFTLESNASLGNRIVLDNSYNPNTWKEISCIYTMTADALFACVGLSNAADSSTSAKVKNIRIFDLTAMFGAGNEPTTTSDPRIKWLQSLGYVGHNAGSLLNYKGTGLKTIGVNQWDEQWEIGTFNSTTGEKADSLTTLRSKNPIPVLANTDYYFKGQFYFILWYDADMKVISGSYPTNTSRTSPANARFLNLVLPPEYGTTYNHDIQIALYHSGGDIPTTYHPYEEHILNLPITTMTGKKDGAGESVVIFPDGMKSAGTAKDYLYGNVLGSFTKAKKVIGQVKLKDLDWAIFSGSFATNISGAVFVSGGSVLFNVPYTNAGYRGIEELYEHSYTIREGGALYIKDSDYSDAASFKAHFTDDDYLYFELATPEDYVLDEPIAASGYVNDWGTEMNLPQGKDEDGQPLTTPLSADVVYGPNVQDAVKNLPKNYIGKDSMEAILTAFVTAGIIGAFTLTYDDETAKYACTITPVTPAE